MSARRHRLAIWLAGGALVVLAVATGLMQRDAAPDQRDIHKEPSAQSSAAPRGGGSAKHVTPAGAQASFATALSSRTPGGSFPQDALPAVPLHREAQAPATVQADAAHSLVLSLQHGDERSPPIARDEPSHEAPTPAELASPSAYRRYENRRQEELYRAYDQHAVVALSEMQRDLERAHAEQLPAELIREGEEKAAKLAETLRALREGELGADAAQQD
jgi:hypothetical protein